MHNNTMYSSHSYPYTMNQSPQAYQQPSTPSPASSMPSLPQARPPPRLSYPHPMQQPTYQPGVSSNPQLTYPGVSSTAMPTPSSVPVGGGAVAGGTGARRAPLEFPLLEHLSIDELTRLLKTEDKMNDIADDGNQNKQRQVDKEMAMAENRSLADFNLSRETRLREGRVQLARLHEEAKTQREIYDEARRKLESSNENLSMDAAKVMLETSASKTEEESEEIAELFLSGGLPLSDFLEQFTQRRMLAHIRRIKSDKMRELMRTQPTRTAPSPQTYVNIDVPMAMPLANTPSPARPAPGIPPRTGGQAPVYQPGFPQQAAMPYQSQNSGPPWTPSPGAVRMPSLPAYPR